MQNYNINHLENKFVFKDALYPHLKRHAYDDYTTFVSYLSFIVFIYSVFIKLNLSFVLHDILRSAKKCCFKAVALPSSLTRTNPNGFFYYHDIG